MIIITSRDYKIIHDTPTEEKEERKEWGGSSGIDFDLSEAHECAVEAYQEGNWNCS